VNEAARAQMIADVTEATADTLDLVDASAHHHDDGLVVLAVFDLATPPLRAIHAINTLTLIAASAAREIAHHRRCDITDVVAEWRMRAANSINEADTAMQDPT
jgi:hypothetical protein